MQLNTGQWVVIGVCFVLIAGYIWGYYVNRRMAEQVLSWLKTGLGKWGQMTPGERLGSLVSGGKLNINQPVEPLQRIEIIYLLAPRENLIFWLFDSLRGRRDELVVKISYRAAPKKEDLLEAGFPRDRDFQQAANQAGKAPAALIDGGLAIAQPNQASVIADRTRDFLQKYGKAVQRLSIRQTYPHLLLRARLKPLLNQPAEAFFTTVRQLKD
jgi:hypothetical protein